MTLPPEVAATVAARWDGVGDAGGAAEPVAGSARATTWRVRGEGRDLAVRLGRPGTEQGFATALALGRRRAAGDDRLAPVVAPLPTRDGAASADLGGRPVTLAPWVAGTPALEADDGRLDRSFWRAVGALLAALQEEPGAGPARQPDPADLVARLEAVRRALADRRDPAAYAGGLRQALRDRRAGLDRASRWLTTPRDHGPLVGCHGDLHLGNVLLVDGAPVVLDWEDAGSAPRELDLLFVTGGGILGDRPVTAEEERWVALGLGRPPTPDPDELAWQRTLRVVEDLVLDAEELLDPSLPPPARVAAARQATRALDGLR